MNESEHCQQLEMIALGCCLAFIVVMGIMLFMAVAVDIVTM